MNYLFANRKSRRFTTIEITCSDGRVEFSTKVEKLNFNFHGKKGYTEINDSTTKANFKLMEFRIGVRDKYAELFAEIGAPPTKEELKEAVTGKSSGIQQRLTYHQALLNYIDACEKGIVMSKGAPLSDNTKRNKISNCRTLIKTATDETLGFMLSKRYHRQESGNAAFEGWSNDVIGGLLEGDYDSSSISTIVNNLKSIIRWNLKRCCPNNLSYVQSVTFKAVSYEVEVMTSEDTEYILSHLEELKRMLSLRQLRALDYLIVALFIAPRVGDMKRLDSGNLYEKNGKPWLKYSQEKTGTVIDVPLNSLVHTTFSRNLITYGKCLPPFTGNLNAAIRKICSYVPSLQTQGSKTRIRGGKRVEVRKPRWEMISIHRMRATAITNMLDAGIPEHVVKSYSGHTGDSKAFARYVKSRDGAKTKASETYIKSIAI